mmetsp:Transcript_42532/g.51654  ORF Transcript_42532/g.51654 Transcript_42532/m.51654 type:complete len:287 (-) Transcript_42532:52-912(-)
MHAEEVKVGAIALVEEELSTSKSNNNIPGVDRSLSTHQCGQDGVSGEYSASVFFGKAADNRVVGRGDLVERGLLVALECHLSLRGDTIIALVVIVESTASHKVLSLDVLDIVTELAEGSQLHLLQHAPLGTNINGRVVHDPLVVTVVLPEVAPLVLLLLLTLATLTLTLSTSTTVTTSGLCSAPGWPLLLESPRSVLSAGSGSIIDKLESFLLILCEEIEDRVHSRVVIAGVVLAVTGHSPVGSLSKLIALAEGSIWDILEAFRAANWTPSFFILRYIRHLKLKHV